MNIKTLNLFQSNDIFTDLERALHAEISSPELLNQKMAPMKVEVTKQPKSNKATPRSATPVKIASPNPNNGTLWLNEPYDLLEGGKQVVNVRSEKELSPGTTSLNDKCSQRTVHGVPALRFSQLKVYQFRQPIKQANIKRISLESNFCDFPKAPDIKYKEVQQSSTARRIFS